MAWDLAHIISIVKCHCEANGAERQEHVGTWQPHLPLAHHAWCAHVHQGEWLPLATFQPPMEKRDSYIFSGVASVPNQLYGVDLYSAWLSAQWSETVENSWGQGLSVHSCEQPPPILLILTSTHHM